MLGIPVTVWLNHLLYQAGRSDQAGSNVDTIIYLLAAVSAVTVGAVLASRRPRHPVGWLLLALGLWFTYGYASYALPGVGLRPPSAPWPRTSGSFGWLPESVSSCCSPRPDRCPRRAGAMTLPPAWARLAVSSTRSISAAVNGRWTR
jgi:hypothetical protein